MAPTVPSRIKKAKAGLKKKKGTSGAARNYVTRNQALKKLQCTLSDFRRLCILKGIYPREPRSRKKANKGSTAPASFYYAKDIAYLLHEPVLQKLREHKAFAKKLSRALGRREDGLAKNLDSAHENYRIDHIIKERYPVFAEAIRDLDDALSLIILFSNLPATPQVSPKVISNCARLAAEWQTYVMKSKSLKKVFLSIKGIYYQAEVEGEKVTWLVPYPFTQNVPPDVDFRIMLTFLELYQTLLGFVFYRLFQTINLIYPPKLDASKDEAGAGLCALVLENTVPSLVADQAGAEGQSGRRTAKSVRTQIKSLISSHAAEPGPPDEQMELDAAPEEPTASDGEAGGLFKPYVFFLSREVTRPMLEFVISATGGEVGWDATLGAGSPFGEADARITHHLIDRPVLPPSTASLPQRAFVQPQWVVDCVNQGKLLPTEEYGPGKILPPHLSPFVDEEEVKRQGGYLPQASLPEQTQEVGSDSDEEEGVNDGSAAAPEASVHKASDPTDFAARPALLAAAADPDNADLVHAAEIEAEGLGLSHTKFEHELKVEIKNHKKIEKPKPTKTGSFGGGIGKDGAGDEDGNVAMAEMMLTGKQKKLYKKMNYSKQMRAEERNKLEAKKKELMKNKLGKENKMRIKNKPT